mmetsp:Transcript_100492/g.173563  ORF Transcript_100492/g.173563 Transcript_100492/m.173563 type:complete len:200 (-) Transcript_100492:471-1070(-)
MVAAAVPTKPAVSASRVGLVGEGGPVSKSGLDTGSWVSWRWGRAGAEGGSWPGASRHGSNASRSPGCALASASAAAMDWRASGTVRYAIPSLMGSSGGSGTTECGPWPGPNTRTATSIRGSTGVRMFCSPGSTHPGQPHGRRARGRQTKPGRAQEHATARMRHSRVLKVSTTVKPSRGYRLRKTCMRPDARSWASTGRN